MKKVIAQQEIKAIFGNQGFPETNNAGYMFPNVWKNIPSIIHFRSESDFRRKQGFSEMYNAENRDVGMPPVPELLDFQ